jgi:hypothetical protein
MASIPRSIAFSASYKGNRRFESSPSCMNVSTTRSPTSGASMPFNTIGPSQLSRMNWISSQLRKMPDANSQAHLLPKNMACCAAGSPLAALLRMSSWMYGNGGRSWRASSPKRAMNVGSEMPCCAPKPCPTGLYGIPWSCGRHPTSIVSTVTTSAVYPFALARPRRDCVSSTECVL